MLIPPTLSVNTGTFLIQSMSRPRWRSPAGYGTPHLHTPYIKHLFSCTMHVSSLSSIHAQAAASVLSPKVRKAAAEALMEAEGKLRAAEEVWLFTLCPRYLSNHWRLFPRIAVHPSPGPGGAAAAAGRSQTAAAGEWLSPAVCHGTRHRLRSIAIPRYRSRVRCLIEHHL